MRLRVAAEPSAPFTPRALPLSFTIDGDVFTVGAIPDAELQDIVAGAAWQRLVPGALDYGAQEYLSARVSDVTDPLDYFHLWRAATDLLDVICGVPWYTATRLLAATRQHWLVWQGWAVMNGFNPGVEPLHRILGAAHAWAMNSVSGDESKTRRLQNDLFSPPPHLGALYADQPHPWMIHDEHQQLLDI